MRHIICASLLALACSDVAAPVHVCPEGAFVLTSDESTASAIGVLPLDGSPAAIVSGSVLGADPALAVSAGRRFVLARELGTIFEVDACGYAIGEFSAGEAGEEKTDPWDVAVASDGSLWIARYLKPSALVLGADGHAIASIDLSAYQLNGTSPNASAVRIVATPSGEKALFLLEGLDTAYASVAPVMAVVDTKTRLVEAAIALEGDNPQALTTEGYEEGALYIAAAGSWDDAEETNAGIERFDTATFETKLVLDEKALGGSATTVAVANGCGAAIVADPTIVNRTSLVVFALDGSNPPQTVFGPTNGFDLHGVLWAKDRLLVGDGATRRVHTFSVGPNCTLLPGTDLAQLPLSPLAFADPNHQM